MEKMEKVEKGIRFEINVTDQVTDEWLEFEAENEDRDAFLCRCPGRSFREQRERMMA